MPKHRNAAVTAAATIPAPGVTLNIAVPDPPTGYITVANRTGENLSVNDSAGGPYKLFCNILNSTEYHEGTDQANVWAQEYHFGAIQVTSPHGRVLMMTATYQPDFQWGNGPSATPAPRWLFEIFWA